MRNLHNRRLANTTSKGNASSSNPQQVIIYLLFYNIKNICISQDNNNDIKKYNNIDTLPFTIKNKLVVYCIIYVCCDINKTTIIHVVIFLFYISFSFVFLFSLCIHSLSF